MTWTRFFDCDVELFTAFAGSEGDTAVTGRVEVGDSGRIFFADLRVVERVKARNRLAGAIIGFFVVVVTTRGKDQ